MLDVSGIVVEGLAARLVACLRGVSEASTPADQVALRPTAFRDLGFHSHDVAFALEGKRLADTQAILVEFEDHCLRCAPQRGARIDLEQSVIRARQVLSPGEHQPERPAEPLGATLVDQVQGIAGSVVIVLQDPVFDRGATVREFHSKRIGLDHDRFLSTGLDHVVAGRRLNGGT